MLKALAWITGSATVAGLLVSLGPGPAQADPKPPKELSKNLVPNGSLDEGDGTPKHWQTVDGLSTFWVKDPDPKRGMVLKMDTDITQEQAYDWWVKIFKGASPKDAPKKIPSTDPNKYDTLAGLDGVWFWSDFIPVEKDKVYWLSVDGKGPGGGLLAWLIGYEEMDKEVLAFGAESKSFKGEALQEALTGKKPDRKRGFKQLVNKYVWKGQLSSVAGSSPDRWQTFTRREQPFRPTLNTPKVRFVRVMLYAYWPPGEYYYDNVRLVEIADNDAGKPKKDDGD
jgi:hypothetical protein